MNRFIPEELPTLIVRSILVDVEEFHLLRIHYAVFQVLLHCWEVHCWDRSSIFHTDPLFLRNLYRFFLWLPRSCNKIEYYQWTRNIMFFFLDDYGFTNRKNNSPVLHKGAKLLQWCTILGHFSEIEILDSIERKGKYFTTNKYKWNFSQFLWWVAMMYFGTEMRWLT